MIFVKRKRKDKLIKEYSPLAKKIRRKIVDLYRPINSDSKNLFTSKIDVMAYIMIGLFSLSAILFSAGINFDYIPFMVGFFINAVFMIYLSFRPLTWSEMYEYEKKYYRELFFLPKDWEPNNLK